MHDAYRSAATRLQEYDSALAWKGGQCGAAFAVAGRVVGVYVYVFSHRATAVRLHPKLVRSYALQCLAESAAEGVAPDHEATVRDFLARAGTAEARSFSAVGLGDASGTTAAVSSRLAESAPKTPPTPAARQVQKGGGLMVHPSPSSNKPK